MVRLQEASVAIWEAQWLYELHQIGLYFFLIFLDCIDMVLRPMVYFISWFFLQLGMA